jgi:hypothetical protein
MVSALLFFFEAFQVKSTGFAGVVGSRTSASQTKPAGVLSRFTAMV